MHMVEAGFNACGLTCAELERVQYESRPTDPRAIVLHKARLNSGEMFCFPAVALAEHLAPTLPCALQGLEPPYRPAQPLSGLYAGILREEMSSPKRKDEQDGSGGPKNTTFRAFASVNQSWLVEAWYPPQPFEFCAMDTQMFIKSNVILLLSQTLSRTRSAFCHAHWIHQGGGGGL